MERKNEIAAKKAKLAELRRQREEREQRQKNLPKAGVSGDDASEVCFYRRSYTRMLTLMLKASPIHPRTRQRPTGARYFYYDACWGWKTFIIGAW